MIRRSSILWSLLFAGTLATCLVVLPGFAQQTGDQPASPPAAPEARSLKSRAGHSSPSWFFSVVQVRVTGSAPPPGCKTNRIQMRPRSKG